MKNEYVEKIISALEEEQSLDVQQYAHNKKCLFDLDERIRQRASVIKILKEALEKEI